MIYGPAILNAEIICYKAQWESVKTVGVSQGRQQEKKLAEETYPQIEKFEDITQKGIMYSLEDGQVDAVIQDLVKAAQLPDYSYKPLSENDFISYVLVVDKEFAETEAFEDFIDSYNQAVSRLNDPEYLAEVLDVDSSWVKDKHIQFLTLDETGVE